MKKSLIIELLIFIVLLTTLSILGVNAFKHTFDIGTTYHLAFKDIDGIVIGSPVRIMGVDIGHVTKIQNSYDEIYIDFVVPDSKLKLPAGTNATIEFFGIAGSRSIELTPPNANTKAEGFIIDEPIRLGHAFSIMSKFLKATMVSIGGLYEFAKGKTQDNVNNITANFLKNTNSADDAIANITATIEEGGAKIHKSFAGTTIGMAKFNNAITDLNISQNFNTARYAVNSSKRTLLRVHRGITAVNEQLPVYTEETANVLNSARKIPEKIKAMDKLSKSICELDKTLEVLDKQVTQENLDKVYDAFENVKFFSENLANYI